MSNQTSIASPSEAAGTPLPRVLGTFFKQVWGGRKNDLALPVGAVPFDATKAVLALPIEELRALEDHDYSTDAIGQAHIEWDGPFGVEIEDSLAKFFGVDAVSEITEQMLAAKRVLYADEPSEDGPKADASPAPGAPTYAELIEAIRVFRTQSLGPDWTAEQAFAFIKGECRSLLERHRSAEKQVPAAAGVESQQIGAVAQFVDISARLQMLGRITRAEGSGPVIRRAQTPQDYDNFVRSQERAAVVRRLQSDSTVLTESGKPFASESSALEYARQWSLGGTHDPKPCEGGWQLSQLSPAAAMDRQRAADGIETYTQAQAAVAAEMGIGVNGSGEWDVDDAGFEAMERRVRARIEEQESRARHGDTPSIAPDPVRETTPRPRG